MSQISFITHNANLRRNRRLITSISKLFSISVPASLLKNSNRLLKADINSLFRLFELGFNSIFTSKSILLDVRAGVFFPSQFKNFILDYPTPYSLELEWLGYSQLSKIIEIQEKSLIKNATSVLVPNELLEKRAKDIGAKNVKVFPNYPISTFKSTVNEHFFKKKQHVPENKKIAVFTAAGRLKEIYGLDLLLQSWKIVEDSNPNSVLVIVGPRSDSDVNKQEIIRLSKDVGIKNLLVTGWVPAQELPDWINIADVCLAPRTKGFPVEWYNDKDSTKISEYAAFSKPIVAAGYSYSDQYLLVEQTADAFAEGILNALNGRVKPSVPHFWADNENELLDYIQRSFVNAQF